MATYGCTLGIYLVLKTWGDAALTEPVAVTTWLVLYRYPTIGFDLTLWCVYATAEISVGVRIYQSETRWEAAVLGIILGGLIGGNVGRLIDGEIDYASVDVGGGQWLATTFPDAALVLGVLLLANIRGRRYLS